MPHRAALAALASLVLLSAACLEARLETLATGLSAPVYATETPAGLLLVEQGGRVLLRDETGALSPWLEIADVATEGEQGLLSVVVSGSRAWAYYVSGSGVSTLSEFTVAPDGRSASAASERVLLEVQGLAINHKGGTVALGPDGQLYLGLGDDNTPANAQSPTTLKGKLLRVDPETGAVEVVARGLRNPYRFSFDALTGDLWIADVGAAAVEEIDRVSAAELAAGGLDFGWPAFEGSRCHLGPCTTEGRTWPVYEYANDATTCAVTGGHVHRGAIPWLGGVYLFADFCAGQVWGLVDGRRIDVSRMLGLSRLSQPVALEPAGQGVAVVLRGGRVLRLE